MKEQDFNLKVLDKIDENVSLLKKMRENAEAVKDYVYTGGDSPAVYVGTYRKYNDGSLFGKWIDITKCYDYEEFMDVCRKLHADEENLELMFQDFENFPEAWYTESCMDEDTFDLIAKYGKLDEEDQRIIDAYIDIHGECRRISDCMKSYMGQFDSEEDFAEYVVNECCNLEEKMGSLYYYFDYKAYARDLFRFDYDFSNGYVFRSY